MKRMQYGCRQSLVFLFLRSDAAGVDLGARDPRSHTRSVRGPSNGGGLRRQHRQLCTVLYLALYCNSAVLQRRRAAEHARAGALHMQRPLWAGPSVGLSIYRRQDSVRWLRMTDQRCTPFTLLHRHRLRHESWGRCTATYV